MHSAWQPLTHNDQREEGAKDTQAGEGTVSHVSSNKWMGPSHSLRDPLALVVIVNLDQCR